MNISRLLLCIAVAMTLAAPVRALVYDDYDDIYYNADKAREKAEKKAIETAKKAQENAQRAAQVAAAANYVPNEVVDYADPSTISVDTSGGLNVDIDTYNRRGQFLVADTIVAEPTVDADTYAYTRRIERFYNGDVVNASGDQTLIDSYYSAPESPDINVYVINSTPFAYGAYNPYSWYNPWNSWAWTSPYWSSWYYSPSWSFTWGYDPWFSWGFGWGPSWGWGAPSWRPVPPPHPGVHRPIYGNGGGNWAVNAPGSMRPHPTSTGSASSSTRRPGAFSAGANTTLTRPGSVSRPGSTHSSNTPTTRPGGSGTTRPGSTSVPTVNTSRGRINGSSSGTVRSNSPSSTSRQSSSSVRNSSGSRSTHGTSGTGSSSTGGGSRGRR